MDLRLVLNLSRVFVSFQFHAFQNDRPLTSKRHNCYFGYGVILFGSPKPPPRRFPGSETIFDHFEIFYTAYLRLEPFLDSAYKSTFGKVSPKSRFLIF